MNTLLFVVFIFFAFLIVWQWRAGQRARSMEGQVAPDTSSVDQSIENPRRVYFFHAVHCKPCKSMMPLVDDLHQHFPNLIKLDISDHFNLARLFRIAGTPTFIAVNDGIIESVKLGPVDEQWLRQHLGAG